MNSLATSPHTRQMSAPLHFSRLQASADDLYPRLFDAILDRRIDPASRFTEDSLKQMFGVSRADVRRVLTQLSHEQVIVLRANPTTSLIASLRSKRSLRGGAFLMWSRILSMICAARSASPTIQSSASLTSLRSGG